MNLTEALAGLDPANDEHWTSDGMPKVDAVSEILTAPVTRRQISDQAPLLTRESAAAGTTKAQEAPPQLPPEKPEEEEPEKPKAPPHPAHREFREQEAAAPVVVEAPYVEPPPAAPAPVEDAELAAFVEIEDDVVGMTERQVYSTLELTDRAIAEFARQAEILTNRRETITAKLKVIGRRTELLEKVRNKLDKGGKTRSRDAVQSYLATQKKVREQRAKRTQRFIQAGTSPKEVLESLGASKLDADLARRKRPVADPRPQPAQQE